MRMISLNNVGIIGDRITVDVTITDYSEFDMSTFNNDIKTCYVYNFRDDNLQLYTWFTEKQTFLEGEYDTEKGHNNIIKGQKYTICGTIKRIETYNGEIQVILSRVYIKSKNGHNPLVNDLIQKSEEKKHKSFDEIEMYYAEYKEKYSSYNTKKDSFYRDEFGRAKITVYLPKSIDMADPLVEHIKKYAKEQQEKANNALNQFDTNKTNNESEKLETRETQEKHENDIKDKPPLKRYTFKILLSTETAERMLEINVDNRNNIDKYLLENYNLKDTEFEYNVLDVVLNR